MHYLHMTMELSVITVYKSSSCTAFFFVSSVLQYDQSKVSFHLMRRAPEGLKLSL